MNRLSWSCICLGIGIILFWCWALLAGGVLSAIEPWPGFKHHELAFAAPDCIVGLVLILIGVRRIRDKGFGRLLLPACGGALIFLGLLDLSYFWLTLDLRDEILLWRTPIIALTVFSAGVYFLRASINTYK